MSGMPFETLDPALLLGAYSVGVFPMADARDARSVYWVEPRRRAILPLDGFHLSRSLRRTIAADRFRVTADRAFPAVIALCAEAAADRPDTWINPSIEQAFLRLHALGHAHSVECWIGDRLAGGLYGLALGRAFFGESMVSRAADASKVAIAHLVARLKAGGFTLLDCQFMTAHLASLGAQEIDRAAYMELLGAALSSAAPSASGEALGAGAGGFRALDALGAVDGAVPGKVTVQLLGQTS
ncbi:leucyl/phenylalanyl-tRNA--protein transferase [Sphingomonas corticis]|jgi:leucyl/phenylalanyl-tRNA--protein transferase|uniref:Leucyl/phenylalanyl-tRNA--protein transferase n=1 Tax=Sphingomonas corticis TaxID=2722791 RepID=A0ABX1CVD7_9SPHN|nr:leucyl/phenylalanyl-tRNA--protein transferase [Sphingomonas corticis]NJR79847.1 leucyl/phenylalanyl-tRNA--protein transferase [Sphingomonas corticis]